MLPTIVIVVIEIIIPRNHIDRSQIHFQFHSKISSPVVITIVIRWNQIRSKRTNERDILKFDPRCRIDSFSIRSN